MTSKYTPTSKTGLSDNGISRPTRPTFSGSAMSAYAVGTDMERNYADRRPKATHPLGNPVMSSSPRSTACGGQIPGTSCISEYTKTKNESLGLMPHEKTEEVSIQIDLTDPEDVIQKLQILDLTDEEEEELLQQAYNLNQKLKSAWFKHQQGTEHIRSFIVSAPAMGEPTNLSGIKLPPLQSDLKAYGSNRSHSKSAGINKHWPATTGLSLQSHTDTSTSYAKLDLPVELKEGHQGDQEKQQQESKWSGSTWQRQ